MPDAARSTEISLVRRDGKIRTPERLRLDEVASLLAPEANVVIGHGGGWPKALVESLVAGAKTPFQIVHNRIDDSLPYFSKEAGDKVRHRGFMSGHNTRLAIHEGRADFVPNNYGRTPAIIRDSNPPFDLAVIHVTPPDDDGWCSLGTCVAYLPAGVETASTVVAQINPQMPRTLGTRIHISAIDYFVDVDAPLQHVTLANPDAATLQIADHVAGIVRDGDVLQLGIGKLGDAILAALSGKSNLRLWTETFSDSAMALLRDGTLQAGPSNEAPITATFVTGSEALYRALDGCTSVSMRPVDETNDPSLLKGISQFVAVNSAIEIDLTGQINAESVNGQLYSGPGGHLDFAIGANYAADGKYICAIPTTARGKSRIVPQLGRGAVVTVPRSLADIVVTEYGIARLRGRTLRERAEALIEIAHPDHQAALRADSDELQGSLK